MKEDTRFLISFVGVKKSTFFNVLRTTHFFIILAMVNAYQFYVEIILLNFSFLFPNVISLGRENSEKIEQNSMLSIRASSARKDENKVCQKMCT